jgi:hypothetical protein
VEKDGQRKGRRKDGQSKGKSVERIKTA